MTPEEEKKEMFNTGTQKINKNSPEYKESYEGLIQDIEQANWKKDLEDITNTIKGKGKEAKNINNKNDWKNYLAQAIKTFEKRGGEDSKGLTIDELKIQRKIQELHTRYVFNFRNFEENRKIAIATQKAVDEAMIEKKGNGLTG